MKPKPTHTQTNPSGTAGCKRGTRTSAHTPPNPRQEWRGTAKTRAQHTCPHRTTQPRMARYKRGAHTNTHTPQHPSQEWRDAAATQAEAHTPAPHPRSGGAADRAGGAHKYTHAPTPHLGVAERSQNPSPSTHDHSAHPGRERRGTSGARTQPRTPQIPNQEWWGAG